MIDGWEFILGYGILIAILLEWLYKIPYLFLKKNKNTIVENVKKDLMGLIKKTTKGDEIELAKGIVATARIRDMLESSLKGFEQSILIALLTLVSGFIAVIVKNAYSGVLMMVSVTMLVLFGTFAYVLYVNYKDVRRYIEGDNPRDYVNIDVFLR